MPTDPAIAEEPDIRAIDGWTLREFAEVTSTNSLAAHLPPWTAVSATVQTAGRGCTGRLEGIDPAGALLLREAAGGLHVLPAHRVDRLCEVFPT